MHIIIIKKQSRHVWQSKTGLWASVTNSAWRLSGWAWFSHSLFSSRSATVVLLVRATVVPNHQRRYAKMEAQLEYILTQCMHIFYTFGPNLYAQSALINKNFCIGAQSESPLSARCWLGSYYSKAVRVICGPLEKTSTEFEFFFSQNVLREFFFCNTTPPPP